MSKSPKSPATKKPTAKAADVKKAKTTRKPSEPGERPSEEGLATDPASAAAGHVRKPAESVAAKQPAKDAKVAKTSAAVSDPALLKRLEEMTDFQLRAYQMSTARISGDAGHVKSGAAKLTLALVEAEVARRKISPERAPSPTRAAVASPKSGKKRD